MKLSPASNSILRNTRRASPKKHPLLCRIFADVKRRNPCGRRLTLKIGELDSPGIALKRSQSTGTVLVDRKDVSMLDEQEIRFLIGHEVGHFLEWHEVDDMPPEPCKLKNTPWALLNFKGWISSQICADLTGVAESGFTFVGGSFLADGNEEMRDLYNDPFEPMPEKFYDKFEIAIRIQALGILAKSEYFYELIGLPLFGFGKNLIPAEEYFERIDSLLDSHMDFSLEQGKALASLLTAAMYIAGCNLGNVRWQREIDAIFDYGEIEGFASFASRDEAYALIKSVSPVVRDIRHPLKNICGKIILDAVYWKMENSYEGDTLIEVLSECAKIA